MDISAQHLLGVPSGKMQFPKVLFFKDRKGWRGVSVETPQSRHDKGNLAAFKDQHSWKDFGISQCNEYGPGSGFEDKDGKSLDFYGWVNKGQVKTHALVFDIHDEELPDPCFNFVKVNFETATIDQALIRCKGLAEETKHLQFNVFLGSSPLTNDEPKAVVERLREWGRLGIILLSQDHIEPGEVHKCKDSYHTDAYENMMARGLENADEFLRNKKLEEIFSHYRRTGCQIDSNPWCHSMKFENPAGESFYAFKSYKFSKLELKGYMEEAGLAILWENQESTMGMYLLVGRSLDCELPPWVVAALAKATRAT